MKKMLLVLVIALWGCARKPVTGKETILARIGDKTISVTEFVERCEYTMRPAWCHGDDYISKKIALNSLIAEKLLAYSAGDDSLLTNNKQVAAYLQGRKEQAMRRIYQYRHGQALLQVDSMLVNTVFRLSQREYDVYLMGASSMEKAQQLAVNMRKHGPILKSASAKDSLKWVKINFNSAIADPLREALFFKPRKKNEIIGPVKLNKDRFVVLRISGWVRRLVLSEQKGRQLRQDIKKRVREMEGLDEYGRHLAGLMKGKSIHFNPRVFKTIVEAIAPFYFRNDNQNKKAFNKKFWHKDDGKMVINDLSGVFDRIDTETFFNFDGKIWTVANFEAYLQVHPLVFRNRKMPKDEFANQFRLAVVDMLRDKTITRRAYLENLDEDPIVKRESNMWRDNLMALHQQKCLLDQRSPLPANAYKQVTKILNPKIDSLRLIYSNRIFINTDAFEKIKLSNIDMFAMREREPFPVPVPEFPQLTTHTALDYGQKLEVAR